MNEILITKQFIKEFDILQCFTVSQKTECYRNILSLKEWAKKDAKYPNTFPTVEQVNHLLKKHRIDLSLPILLMEDDALFSAARIWYILRCAGAREVFILNQSPVDDQCSDAKNLIGSQIKELEKHYLDYDDLIKVQNRRDHVIIDARSEGRFHGTEPEPRNDIPSGNIPKSKNLPYTDLMDVGYFKDKSILREYFNELNIANKSVVFTCGSGVTACILLVAYLEVFGLEQWDRTTIYDGSWTEYASETL